MNNIDLPSNPFPVDHKWQLHEIARRNDEAGYKYFGEGAMSWFGDKMSYFVTVHAEGKTYIKRIRNARKKPACVPSEVGKMCSFDPETGKIDTIPSDDPARFDIPRVLLKNNHYYKDVMQ